MTTPDMSREDPAVMHLWLVIRGAPADLETPLELLAVCTSAGAAQFFAAVSPHATDAGGRPTVILAPVDQPLDASIFAGPGRGGATGVGTAGHSPAADEKISVERFAELLSVTRPTALNLLDRGVVPSQRLSNGVRVVRYADADAYRRERERRQRSLAEAVDEALVAAEPMGPPPEMVSDADGSEPNGGATAADVATEGAGEPAGTAVIPLDPDVLHGGLVHVVLPLPPRGHGWRVEWRSTIASSEGTAASPEAPRPDDWTACKEGLLDGGIHLLVDRTPVPQHQVEWRAVAALLPPLAERLARVARVLGDWAEDADRHARDVASAAGQSYSGARGRSDALSSAALAVVWMASGTDAWRVSTGDREYLALEGFRHLTERLHASARGEAAAGLVHRAQAWHDVAWMVAERIVPLLTPLDQLAVAVVRGTEWHGRPLPEGAPVPHDLVLWAHRRLDRPLSVSARDGSGRLEWLDPRTVPLTGEDSGSLPPSREWDAVTWQWRS